MKKTFKALLSVLICALLLVSAVTPAFAAIGKVKSLTLSAVTPTSATLQWKKVSNAKGYEIQRYQSSQWKKVATTSSTSYTVKGLKLGTTYKFRVRAYSSAYGAFSSALSVQTGPSNVKGFKAESKTVSSIKLVWKKGSDATGYRIQQYIDKEWATVVKSTKKTTATIKNVTPGKANKFRIAAIKKVDGKTYLGVYSSVLSVKAPALSKPTALKTVSATDNSVTLTWNAVPGATSYNVYTVNGDTQKIVAKPASNTCTVTGLSAATDYTFSVRTVLKGSVKTSYSPFSDKLSVRTAPAKVTSFNIPTSSEDAITLSWKAVSGAEGYEIWQFSSATSMWNLVGTSSRASYTVFGLSSMTSYKFKVRPYHTVNGAKLFGAFSNETTASTSVGSVSDFTLDEVTSTSIKLSWKTVPNAIRYQIEVLSGGATVASVSAAQNAAANSITTTVNGLNPYTRYTVRVSAVFTGSQSIPAEKQVITAPAKVTGLSGKAVYEGVELTWTAAPGADMYELSQYSTLTSSWVIVASTSNTNYTVAGLPANSTNLFRVRAYRTNSSLKCYGPYSDSATVKATDVPVTPPTPTKPSAPTGVSATNTSSGTSYSIRVSWSAVSGADGYEVYNGSGTSLGTTASTSYTATNLSASTTYSFKVKAYVNSGSGKIYSDYSQTVSAKTSAAPVDPPVDPPVNPPTTSGSVIPESLIDKNAPVLTKTTSKAISGLSVELDKLGKRYTITWTPVSDAVYHIEYFDASQNKWLTITNSTFLARLNIDLAEGNFGAKYENASDNVSKVTWSSVSGSAGYEIRNEIANNTNSWSDAISKTSTSADLRLAPNAEQKVRISALGSVKFRIYALDIETEKTQLACSEYTPKVYIGYQDLTFKTPTVGTLSSSSSAGLKEAYTLMLVQAINNTRCEKGKVTLREVSSLRTEVSPENIHATFFLAPVAVTEDMLEGLAPSESKEMTCTFNSGYGNATIKSTVDNGAPTTSERTYMLYSAITPFASNYLYDQHNISSFNSGVKSVSATAGSNGSYTVTVVLNQEKVTATNLPKYHPGFCDSIANSADSLAEFGNNASATVGDTTITAKINKNYTLDSLEIASPFSVSFAISQMGMNMSGTLPGTSHYNYQFTR